MDIEPTSRLARWRALERFYDGVIPPDLKAQTSGGPPVAASGPSNSDPLAAARQRVGQALALLRLNRSVPARRWAIPLAAGSLRAARAAYRAARLGADPTA